MAWQDSGIIAYVLLGLGIWLALLSFYSIRTLGRLRKMLKGPLGHTNGRLIESVAGDLGSKQIEEIRQSLDKLETKSKNNFQKYALVRFNPFEDTGGDQSFVVALLDGENSGVVISSLHSRAGTRVYAKQVTHAKATTHQFSKEEKEVVEKAARHA